MEGAILKEKLRSLGVNFNELSAKLGYANDQNLHAALAAKDVKSGLIEKIAVTINRPVGWFYGEASTVGDMSQNTNSQVTNLPDGIISLFQKKDEQIDRLLSIIEQLNKK